MPPDPGGSGGIRGNPGNPGMSSRPRKRLQTSIKKSPLGPPWRINFRGFSRKEPQGTPRRPKGSQREPKGAPRHPKQGQRQHQRGTKGAQWRPRGTQRNPLAPKREFKGSLYTQKLPINRTSGRYVISCTLHSGQVWARIEPWRPRLGHCL